MIKYKKVRQERYLIRKAGEDYIADLSACYTQLERRSPLSSQMDEIRWRYELSGKSEKKVTRVELYMITDLEGRVVGALGVPVNFWGLGWVSTYYELKPGVDYLAVTPVVLRFLHALGQQRGTPDEPYRRTGLFLGEDHPAYLALETQNSPPNRSYTWYLRVPDLPAFLRRIAPVHHSATGAVFLSRYDDCREALRDSRFGKATRGGESEGSGCPSGGDHDVPFWPAVPV